MNTIIQQKQTSEFEEIKVFLNNAFFFLAHRARIMRDSRMVTLIGISSRPLAKLKYYVTNLDTSLQTSI